MNILQYIVENIFIFLPLAITAMIITIILCVTGKKDEIKEETSSLGHGDLEILKIKTNVFTLIYLFILMMMLFVGVISGFYIPTIIGGIIATIPIIIVIMATYVNNKSKVP